MLTVDVPDPGRCTTPVPADELERVLGDSLREEDVVEVVLVDPGYMRVLNRRYRHLDAPTDVLAFDLRDPSGEAGSAAEGVVYVNHRECSGLEDLLRLVFHGYLHLRGATHDTEDGARRMDAEVERLVGEALGRSGGGR